MTPHDFTRDCAEIGFDVTTLAGQADAAPLFDAHPRTVRKWARGEIAVNPAAAQLLRIVIALDLPGPAAIEAARRIRKLEARRQHRADGARAQA